MKEKKELIRILREDETQMLIVDPTGKKNIWDSYLMIITVV